MSKLSLFLILLFVFQNYRYTKQIKLEGLIADSIINGENNFLHYKI